MKKRKRTVIKQIKELSLEVLNLDNLKDKSMYNLRERELCDKCNELIMLVESEKSD